MAHSKGILLAYVAFAASLCATDTFLPEWNAGYQGQIPKVPVGRTLSAEEITSAGQAVIQKAIDEIEGPAAVLVPAGVFELHLPIRMKDGVVLRAADVGGRIDEIHPGAGRHRATDARAEAPAALLGHQVLAQPGVHDRQAVAVEGAVQDPRFAEVLAEVDEAGRPSWTL